MCVCARFVLGVIALGVRPARISLSVPPLLWCRLNTTSARANVWVTVVGGWQVVVMCDLWRVVAQPAPAIAVMQRAKRMSAHRE